MKHLDALTARAQEAAKAVQIALQFDSVESRRKRVLAYGQALLAIRKEIANKNAFHAHIKKNGLEVRDWVFRSNAMWLAEHWSDVVNSLHQCPHANPGDIRHWYRQHGPQAAEVKPKTDKPIDYSKLPAPINLGPYSEEHSDGNPWAPSGIYPGLEQNRQGKRVGDTFTITTPHMLACNHLWGGQPLDGLTAAICYGCCDLGSVVADLRQRGLKINFGRVYQGNALARLNQHPHIKVELHPGLAQLAGCSLIPEYRVVEWLDGETKPPRERI